jgi:undecaprenyl diphosphate synthase
MPSSRDRKLNVAIIMDGNGRWATRRGLPRHAGHEAGVEALRRTVEAAPGLGIGTLTVYAFSADNWRRPKTEVRLLMALLRHYLETEIAHLAESETRLSVIGRRDRLPDGIADAIARAEGATATNTGVHLRIAIDYSARESILSAMVAAAEARELTREAFVRRLSSGNGHGDVDLLIRTSGEQRLSDFLLWESAYAELHFTDRLWPDFGADDLGAAVGAFHRRERRFGGLGTPVAAA